MARLPIIKRITREDVSQAPSWIENLIFPINQFMESVFRALDRNLTFTDNFSAQIQEIEFDTSSAYDGTAANFDTLEFSRTIKTLPRGLFLMQILQVEDNHTPIESAVYIDWLDDNWNSKDLSGYGFNRK